MRGAITPSYSSARRKLDFGIEPARDSNFREERMKARDFCSNRWICAPEFAHWMTFPAACVDQCDLGRLQFRAPEPTSFCGFSIESTPPQPKDSRHLSMVPETALLFRSSRGSGTLCERFAELSVICQGKRRRYGQRSWGPQLVLRN